MEQQLNTTTMGYFADPKYLISLITVPKQLCTAAILHCKC